MMEIDEEEDEVLQRRRQEKDESRADEADDFYEPAATSAEEARCFTKRMVKLLAEQTHCSELEVYSKYLQATHFSTMHVKSSFQEEKVLKYLYGGRCSQRPYAMNLLLCHHIARLESCLGIRMQIYSQTEELIYDGTIAADVIGQDDLDPRAIAAAAAAAAAAPPLLNLRLADLGNRRRRYRVSTELALDIEVKEELRMPPPPPLPQKYLASCVMARDKCLFRDTLILLEQGLDEIPPGYPHYSNFDSMLLDQKELNAYWGNLHPVLYVAQTGCHISSLVTRRRKPSQHRFFTLGEFGGEIFQNRGISTSRERCAIVGVTRTHIFLLQPSFEKHIRSKWLNIDREASSSKPPPLTKLWGAIKATAAAAAAAAAARSAGESTTSATAAEQTMNDGESQPPPPPPPPHVSKPFPCACQLCRSVSDPKVKRTGQKVYRSEMDIACYMQILGLDTEDNNRRLSEAVNCSVASYDIESYSIPNAPADSISEQPRHDMSSSASERTSVVATQEIALIGLGTNTGDGDKFACFSRGHGEEQISCQEVIDRFYTKLLEESKLIAEKKLQLLQPLTDFVEEFHQRHMAFFSKKGLKKSDAESGWRCSLLGSFSRLLQKFLGKLYIFGFNSKK